MNVFEGSGASKFLVKWTQILAVVLLHLVLLLAFLVKILNQVLLPTFNPAKKRLKIQNKRLLRLNRQQNLQLQNNITFILKMQLF